jgi:signal transduction histidine kinase
MIEKEALRRIPVMSDLSDEQLEWISENCEDIRLKPGEIVYRDQDPADYMYIVLEGEFEARSDHQPAAGRLYGAEAGAVTGLLPFSRLAHFVGTARAVSVGRFGRMHKRAFPEMLQRMPLLVERLIGILLDRVREYTRVSEQNERLAALGKLSAGLAHELNNPAAAAKRAADSLLVVREALRSVFLHLDRRALTTAQREYIVECEKAALERMTQAASTPLSPIEQSDHEEELAGWMDRHSVPESWKLAPILVEARVTQAELDELVRKVGADALSDVLVRLNYALEAARLVQEIHHSATRISELVQAIKEYTYMDQAPEQEIDIHSGIESTLTILAHKIRKKSINVVRDYNRELPKICAHGVELNQVWTNLIVNAIEAMTPGGELRIRTREGRGEVTVEIQDNGSGIPPEVLPHIFDPFYTTKGVGEGTGLGLDTCMRVVKKHRGSLRVQSKPGETVFQVVLPLKAN